MTTLPDTPLSSPPSPLLTPPPPSPVRPPRLSPPPVSPPAPSHTVTSTLQSGPYSVYPEISSTQHATDNSCTNIATTSPRSSKHNTCFDNDDSADAFAAALAKAMQEPFTFSEGKKILSKLLNQFPDILPTKDRPLGRTHIVEHSITLEPGAKPVYIPAYKNPPSRRQILEDEGRANVAADTLSRAPIETLQPLRRDDAADFPPSFSLPSSAVVNSASQVPPLEPLHKDEVYVAQRAEERYGQIIQASEAESSTVSGSHEAETGMPAVKRDQVEDRLPPRELRVNTPWTDTPCRRTRFRTLATKTDDDRSGENEDVRREPSSSADPCRSREAVRTSAQLRGGSIFSTSRARRGRWLSDMRVTNKAHHIRTPVVGTGCLYQAAISKYTPFCPTRPKGDPAGPALTISLTTLGVRTNALARPDHPDNPWS
ncbi:hypothetical protein C7M84_001647 [Penaeus vannamei]|uniref:Uncharacterized protein n=1 Tax=Penaeus vannamei TaxID=6689 RepID=A0A3R7QI37_PENVA|nr:hypothetical protein C7M84_001647 [Penaeus vannamei]